MNLHKTLGRRRLKAKVIAFLGGKCQCCGEKRQGLLSLDHIHGGGGKHRKTCQTDTIYVAVKRDPKARKRYRILCLGCNQAIWMWGRCPHQDPSAGTPEEIEQVLARITPTPRPKRTRP